MHERAPGPSGTDPGSDLLFFTYADARYDVFAAPYAYFALAHNPGALVEIALEDLEGFLARNEAILIRLRALFGDRFLFRESTVDRAGRTVRPGTIRFVEQPRLRARNVYIGDVDLLVMEDVLARHTDLMTRHGLPFSNVIRPGSIAAGKPRLSGLHFCPYDLMYPLPDVSDLDLRALLDEHVLHTIMSRHGSMVPESFSARPQCGIHMSLSRDPWGRCPGPSSAGFDPESAAGWSGREYDDDGSLERLLRDEGFRAVFPDFPFEFRLLFAALEARMLGAERALHRIASSYLVDRRISADWATLTRRRLETEHDAAAAAGRRGEADRVAGRIARLWPRRPESWQLRASSAFSSGEDRLAIEALQHALDQSPAGGASAKAVKETAAAHRERISAFPEGARLLARIDGEGPPLGLVA